MPRPRGKTSAPLRIGLFPGTFDPITNGHLDVIKRGRTLFDRLIVAIAHNSSKRELFTVEERLEMIGRLVATKDGSVVVDSFTGMTVDYARKVGATAILRGLRNVSDLAYEFQLALTNRAVADVETVFIMTAEQYAFTSSSLIKQIAAIPDSNVGRLHRLLPPLVLRRLHAKRREMGGRFPSPREERLDD